MARVLVTGASGFIGSVLVKALEEHHDVHAWSSQNGGLTSAASLSGMPVVDHVFHLAGKTFVPASWTDPNSFISANVMGTTAVLQYCEKFLTPLTLVSAYVYGQPTVLPIDEHHPVNPSNPYALSKWLAEEVARFYHSSSGVPVSIVRPFNVYGPGQDQRFLLPSVMKQALCGSEIVVDSLEPRRDYVFVDDVVEALIATMAADLRGLQVFNVASGISWSVGDLVAIIQGVAGTSLPVVERGIVRPHEILDVVGDPGWAYEKLGWCARTAIQDGIRTCLEQAVDTLLGADPE